MPVKGDVNGVRGTGEIWGWALNTDAPDETQLVRLTIGDQVFEVRADKHRPDLAKGFGGNGNHGFVFAPPPTLPSGQHEVEVVALPSETPLPRGKFTLTVAGDSRLRARISSFLANRVTGWAYDSEDSGRALVLEMFVDHKPARKVPCEILRKDIEGHIGVERRVGFHTALPIEFWDGEAHRVTLKEVESGQLLHDGWLRTEKARIVGKGGKVLFGRVTDWGPAEIAGWATDGSRPLPVELEIDDILIERTESAEPVQLDTRRTAGFHFRSLPAHIFDDRAHKIAVYAVNGERTLIASKSSVLPAEASPRLDGRLLPAEGGRLRGWAVNPAAPEVPVELGLMVGGTEVMTTLTRPSGEPKGSFEFVLPPQASTQGWLDANVEVVSFPRGLRLPFEGRHPITDSITGRLETDSRGSIKLVVESGAPLPPHLTAELRAEGKAAESVSLTVAKDGLSAQGELGRMDARTLTGLTIAGVSVALSGLPGIGESEAPLKGSSGRIPGAFLPVQDSRVQHRLSDLARRKVEPEGDTERPDFSGVWRFVPPATVEGWAIDLANPADPLEIELVVDGAPLQRVFARQSVNPREARLRFNLPIGFRFDLSALDIKRGGLATLEARVVGGGTLLPGKPQKIDLGAIQLSVGGIRAIDTLAAAGRLPEAYLKARALAEAGGPALVHRLLALDYVLRTDWHDYPRFLERWGDRAAHGFASALLEAFRAQLTRDGATGTDLAAKGELPSAPYGKLFAAAATPAAPVAPEVAFATVALWITLNQLPVADDLQPRHDRVAIILPPGGAPDAYQPLAALGCAVLAAPGKAPLDAAVAALEKATRGRTCFVVLREPLELPVTALGYWPLLASGRGTVAASVVRLGEQTVSPMQVSFIAREEDARVLICTDAAAAIRAAQGLYELPGAGAAPVPDFLVREHVSLEAAYPAPTCVIVHDLDEEAEPASPAGARVIRAALADLPDPDDEGDGEIPDPFAQAWADIAAVGLPHETPIIFMSRLYQYPPDYAARCLREFVLTARERSVVTSALTYAPDTCQFSLSANSALPAFFMGLRERGCYRLSDLLASAERYPPFADSRIVVATAHPFKLISEGDSVQALVNDAAALPLLHKIGTALHVRERGFAAHVLSTWAGAAEAAGMPPPQFDPQDIALVSAMSLLTTSARERAQEPDFFVRLQDLARRGHCQAVATYLEETALQPDAVLKLDEDRLTALLNCCKAVGLQALFNTRMFPHLPVLIARSHRLVMPLFENMAMSLPVAEVTAVLMASAALILPNSSSRPVFRLIAACRRYCSGETMALLVGMVNRSTHKPILADPSIAETVGAALALAAPSCLEAVAHEPDAPFFAPPLLDRMVTALLEGDAQGFVRLMNAYLAEQRSMAQLILRLRTYTYEITQLAIPAGAILYPADAAHKEVLALAILLDDHAAIAQFDGGGIGQMDSTDDAHGIVAASYHRNMRPLDRAFERWARACGIAPVSFSGETIEELFANFTTQPLPPPAAVDHGRATVILTVYNPELPLLASALSSLTRQTYRNLEIILVDDASDFVPAEEIEAMADRDPRIRFLRMARNVGPYVGRNRALEIATGDFVAIHDGDDYAHPQRLEAQIDALAASPLLKLSTAAHLRIDKLARLQFEHTLDILGDGTMTSVFRREVFDVIGGFAPVRSRGDVEFRERLKATYGAHVYRHVNCPLTFCFATPASLSNSVTRALPDYLALFREALAKRVRIPVLGGRRAGTGTDAVPIPWPLRSENLLS